MNIWLFQSYRPLSVAEGQGFNISEVPCFAFKGSKVKLSNGTFKNIEDVGYGEEIVTGYGNNYPVESLYKYDVDETISKINLENGDSIECTQDHKIFVVRKGVERKIENAIWIKASELQKGDALVKGI